MIFWIENDLPPRPHRLTKEKNSDSVDRGFLLYKFTNSEALNCYYGDELNPVEILTLQMHTSWLQR